MPYFQIVEPRSFPAADRFAFFICELSNGQSWMETCKVDEHYGIRMSPDAWFEISIVANEGTERPRPDFVPSVAIEVPRGLMVWHAATFSYDGEEQKLPLDSNISIDPSVGLSCRVGLPVIEQHFDDHIAFESSSTRYFVFIKKPHLHCENR